MKQRKLTSFALLLAMAVALSARGPHASAVRSHGAPEEDHWQYLPMVLRNAPLWRPSPGASWQIQFSGALDTSLDVDIYDLDLFDVPKSLFDQLHAEGRKVICYFSAGSWEDWRPDADQFPEVVKGNDLDGWPGEKWLDIRRLDVLGSIMAARLDKAVQKGCDGVDPDNVDGYANSTGFPLSAQDQLTYNIWIAEAAHQRGLAVGLKNDLDQIATLLPYFDWALNEQCFQYNECDVLLPFVQAGKPVFGIEYQGNPAVFCTQANAMDFDFLKKNLDLDAWRIACR
ncbi:MAG: endo alpha-1,4 polygalactosaminidase [Anaerolineales bacterium]|nr:endo alpha-1,4 polygalactosaminidase [Anaerolineales bacterium]